MQPVLNILEQLTYQAIVGTQTAKAYRLGPIAVLGTLFVAGCLFLAFGVFFALTAEFGTPMAAVITGAALIFITALVLWYMDIRARREILIAEAQHREMIAATQNMALDAELIKREVEEYTYNSPIQSMIFSAIAGYLVTDLFRR